MTRRIRRADRTPGCAAFSFRVAAAIVAAAAGLALPAGAEESAATALYRGEGRRDPFAPLVRDGRLVVPPTQTGGDEKGSSVLPVLHGILWDAGGRSLALIDDRELQAGQSVRGYEIVEIRKNAVTLVREGKEVTLRLELEGQTGSALTGQTQGGGGRP